ncbi:MULTISPECIES: Smr/MutS family protein [Prevotella]|uniref:Endonuclease MutS2 n=1 Tax=Prevotella melaninogenica TaxID=28132 RepID=A0ABX7XMQ8_9BACT|nr:MULTISPECIES: Smr/MutS family protein [Prevotella]QUB74889.1 Smr/MutS family protein [Prevotella melaninogenica]
MIYPKNFEQKIGFTEVRSLLRARCLSTLGKERIDEMNFSTDATQVNIWMEEIREFRRIQEGQDEFPLDNFFDVRESVARIRLEGTHMEVEELFDLKRSLETIIAIVSFLSRGEETEQGEVRHYYPALYNLADGVATFPLLVQRISQIIDKFGKMRDNASPELLQIRRELARIEGSISRTLYGILRAAQGEGLVEKDVTPTLRDGRLVIPVAPGLKRKISGIVHDESATGRTVYIEPSEVVDANNKIRELENEERREMIRILTDFAKKVRPNVREILDSYNLMAAVDFIRAKAELARLFKSFEPQVAEEPHIDWIRAIHPLLQLSLERKNNKNVSYSISVGDIDSNKVSNEVDNRQDYNRILEEEDEARNVPSSVVPLDIQLTKDKHLLIISGPNAGGKSVCLKTVGLLQYMLQCGLSIPVGDRSKTGIFADIMIDIGDEQSIENDLSTYSSHLMNMKIMMRRASDRTLILIDEFGTGTEPQIGGAIAEAVLRQFWKKHAWAVITTHYQNLKHFAEEHPGTVNGAMLYDRHEMRPLFQLAIGRPGSSFAIEIARKTGIPEEVIRDASEIVGSDYIQSDKYLQDIVRDKRYWENKRQTIHSHEKELEKRISQYEKDIAALEQSRKEILNRAKAQAEEIIKESNRRIENAIREIKEKQAEKEETKRIRQELAAYEAGLLDGNKNDKAETSNKKKLKSSGLLSDDDFQKKVDKIKSRKERHEQHLKEKASKQQAAAEALKNAVRKQQGGGIVMAGDSVRIKGLTTVGKVESIEGKQATVIFGGMRTKMAVSRLEHVDTATIQSEQKQFQAYNYSRETRETIDKHRNQFRQELDIRGMRADEALNQVQYFIDDAILVGASQVRILHGKGNGILRQLIRQYLGSVPNVTNYRDEHVQFGGAGITVVEL